MGPLKIITSRSVYSYQIPVNALLVNDKAERAITIKHLRSISGSV